MTPVQPIRLTITILYFIVCCILFALPGNELPKASWLDGIFFDKWVHIGLFGLLAILCCWSLPIPGRRPLRFLFGSLCFYGLLVEIVQGLWVPFRSFDLWDLAADASGALLGTWIWKRFLER
jgi:hypothetical protein